MRPAYSVIVLCLSVCRGNDEREDFLEQVESGVAPWLVLVLPNNNKLYCSGVLLGWDWVLTSAHCMFTQTGTYTEHDESVTVVAGTPRGEAGNTTQARQSKRLHLHTMYTFTENFIHDLVVIQVNEAFTASEWVKVAPLVGESNVQTLAVISQTKPKHKTFTGTLYGFGRVRRGRSSSKDNTLKSQDFKVSRNCQCLRRVRSARSTHSILSTEETLLCREQQRNAGLCDGDNGGALISKGALRGLATTLVHYTDAEECDLSTEQHECGDSRSISVFTDLCPYGDWLSQIVPHYPNTDENCRI